jgi:putative ABC transport system substrate-binding protein
MDEARRRLLRLLGGLAAALSFGSVSGQTGRAPKVVGWLSPITAENQKAMLDLFIARLKELGHAEGRDFRIEARWAAGSTERLAPLAKELVALRPAVIVTSGTAAVGALKKQTAVVPIVFATGGDPVQSGFAASLARPGGNITGVTLRAGINAKLFGLVREALPGSRRVVLLTHESDPIAARIVDNFTRAAPALRYELSIVGVKQAEDFERAFAQAAKHKAQAVVAPQFSLFFPHIGRIAALAVAGRVPLFSTIDGSARAGGLMSYSGDLRENFRSAAGLVDKILRGTKPGDLAVEQPDRFNLVVNLRTARAIGIKIPQPVLARADEVIE